MIKIKENILSWCSNPEQEALKQAENLSKHPCLAGNVCLMPDTHSGYGMPIGGVVALKDAVSPNMVGVDIGCGMLAVKTSLTSIETETLKQIVLDIKEMIPVGFNHQKEKQENDIFKNPQIETLPVCSQQIESAKKQLGTLGGGNHFIEIQEGGDGHIWFMIHSGSRNLGKKVADHYNNIAVELCKKFKQHEVVKNDLAFLPLGIDEANLYLKEMKFCLDFAYENRQHMANIIKSVFTKRISDSTDFLEQINIHHNYAAIEKHYSQNVWVHRKGATLARENTIGIIPGSQGTSSYIVQGLGNPASLCSCSHGAGRKMSRKKARETLNLAQEQASLESKGILHSVTDNDSLDEAPSAYKDIDIVMEEQKDLVKILVKLKPLAVIKG